MKPMRKNRYSYDSIASLLSPVIRDVPESVGQKPAAVAMILNETRNGLDIFFIERARHPGDPWSGNIGFPGGRKDPSDSDLKQTAERETIEEVGIDLVHASYLGRLPDVVGKNLPVRVSCFVYGLHGPVTPVISDEVNDTFWFGLSELSSPDRHVISAVRFEDRVIEAPAINLGLSGKPVLWGITYRLVSQFREVVDTGCTAVIPYELSL